MRSVTVAGGLQGDGPDVELVAPADDPAVPAGAGWVRRSLAGDGGGVPNSVLEVGDGQAGRWGQEPGVVVGVQAVEAEQDVEVDCATDLVFGGLAVGDPDAVGQAAVAGELVEVAFDGLFGAAPQFPGGVVPDDVGLVVIAVRAQRLPEHRVAGAVPGEAGYGPAVRAGLRVAAGVTRLRFARAAGLVGAAV